MFIKPQLVRNSVDARRVAEEFRDRLETMRAGRSVVIGADAPVPKRRSKPRGRWYRRRISGPKCGSSSAAGCGAVALISALSLPWPAAIASITLGALMIAGADVDARDVPPSRAISSITCSLRQYRQHRLYE